MKRKFLASTLIISSLFGLYEHNNKAYGFPFKNLPIKELQNIEKNLKVPSQIDIEKQFKIPSQTNKVNLPENATIEDYIIEIEKEFNDRKRYKVVLELANRAIELEPEGEKIHEVYYYRQKANLELGEIEENSEYFQASLEDNKNIRKLNPTEIDGFYLKNSYLTDIVTYEFLNDEKNLKNSAQTALKKFKNDELVHKTICKMYSIKKFSKEALKVCDKAISLNPKDIDSLLVRATVKIDDLGDKKGGCNDVKQGSLLGDKKSKKLYSQFCATPREKAEEECNSYENMIVMGMNPAAIIQGQIAVSGGDPKVMEKHRIMRGICPDVFVQRRPSGLYNNNY